MNQSEPISLLQELQTVYGIDPKDVRRLEGKPWLSSEQLAIIARKSGGFTAIDVDFREYVSERKQVLWVASLTDSEGKVYRRTGSALIGEKLPNGEDVSEDSLAASRALRSALAMAGFDVFKGASVIKLQSGQPSKTDSSRAMVEWPVRKRTYQSELHALATEVGLITHTSGSSKKDMTGYRAFLLENFDVDSSVNFTEEEFGRAIDILRAMKSEK